MIAALLLALTFTGPITSAHDGDTIHVAGGERLRLAEMDAPELGQTCLDAAGQPYNAGAAARRHLLDLVAGRSVTCKADARDPYGRPISTCTTIGDAISLNQAMVRDGWAFSAYGTAYQPDQAVAIAAHLGIWQGACAAPRTYRCQHHVGRACR